MHGKATPRHSDAVRGAATQKRENQVRKRGLEGIEGIVQRWMKTHKVLERTREGSIYERWHEIVGEDIASQSRAVDLRAGKLVIEVDSPALLFELSTYYRAEILASLRNLRDLPEVHELQFRPGCSA